MGFVVKLAISIAIIVVCTQIGRRLPSLAGLVATMPLTGLIVLVWIRSDNPGNYDILIHYAKGALWGIVPSIFFFLTALFCFERHLPLAVTLSASFAVWLLGALLHQWLLR